MRVSSLMEQVQEVQDKRSALYQAYDDAINKFKKSKDTSSFTANRECTYDRNVFTTLNCCFNVTFNTATGKKIDADHKALTQQIASMQAQLKSEGSDATEKVAIPRTVINCTTAILFHTFSCIVRMLWCCRLVRSSDSIIR